jgi:single-strand DNA-binding protein
MRKGKQVYVEGKIRTRSWDDKEGKKRWTTEVVASNVVLLGQAADVGRGMGNEPAEGLPEPAPHEDDIPF